MLLDNGRFVGPAGGKSIDHGSAGRSDFPLLFREFIETYMRFVARLSDRLV